MTIAADILDLASDLSKQQHDKIKKLVEKWKNDRKIVESFQKGYGEDWLSVMFGTATNIIKRQQ